MEVEEQHHNMKNSKNRVKVAVRVRPMISKQSSINQSSCIQYLNDNKILIGKDRCFAFDNVFSQKSSQEDVYQKCVKDLVLGCFQGYNAAVLAYGQTGSGKTFTMGTGSVQIFDEESSGIIPRVIKEIFNQTSIRKEVCKTIIKVSFIQIYNQQIIDLLGTPNFISSEPLKNLKHSITKDSSMPSIREQKDGSISLINIVEETITSQQQTLELLHKGGRNRTTSSTLMNDCSSRSHGIFSIHIEQHPVNNDGDEGFITAKFYFVDLAGSERVKKTGASGMTFREGISINLGLLELGNVISALSVSERREGQFITYRNSKLTRILQDSLGGNSNTYMISCISPAQSNYEESLNTIKYATKAMNIKNKPIINRDPHSAQVNALKQRILQLEIDNKNLKKLLQSQGIVINRQSFRNDYRSDILSQQIRKLKGQIAEYEEKMMRIENDLKQHIKKKNQLEILNYELRRDRDKFRLAVQKSKNGKGMRTITEEDFECDEQFGLIQEYQGKIRQLQTELFDQQKINNRLQQEYEKLGKQMAKDESIIIQKNRQILKLKSNIKSLHQSRQHQSLPSQHSRQGHSQLSQYSQVSQQNRQGIIGASRQPVMKDIFEQNVENGENQSQCSEQGYEMFEIDDNEELIEAQADYRASANVYNQKLNLMESQIRQQEEQLQAMTEEQINLEYQLISEMKEEYHQKIMTLQKEKLSMIKQQQEMAGYEKNPKLKVKIENLEMELRELRKKAKQQISLQKQVSMQNEQIKKLAGEIKVHRVHKIEINRKIKEDKNAYDKFKKERLREILLAKKENVRKDKQIRKLALENKRKSIQMSKKNEELMRVRKVNEAIKSYSRQNKKKAHSYIFSHQPKNKKNFQQQSDSTAYQTLSNLHSKSIQFMMEQQEIRIQMNKFDNRIQELENEIEKIIEEEANLQLRLDRMEMVEKYNECGFDKQHDEMVVKLTELKQRVGLIEENIVYCQGRYNQLGCSMPNFNEEIDIINNGSINTIGKWQMMIKMVYDSLRRLVINNILSVRNEQIMRIENQDLHEQVEKVREELCRVVNEHHFVVNRLREDIMNKYYSNLEDQHNDISTNSTLSKAFNNKLEDRQRKNYERKVLDLTKTNRQLSADVEMWRRKCSVVQEKYHNINMRMAKDKFIGRPREEDVVGKKNSTGWNYGGVSTAHMLDEVNLLIDKLDNKKKGNMSEDEDNMQNVRNSEDIEFARNKWQCVMNLKASRSPILSMATSQNMLVTSGTKSISIYDQQTCQLIADLSNHNCLQGFVKSVRIIPQFSLLAAACQKQVLVWDIRSYSSISVLKAHKDQVRSIYSVGNTLFTAGKGTVNSGGLMMWDLRMIENQLPYEQKQRNSDIFAMTSKGNTLYYGTRNHQVRRLSLQSRQVLSPFQPPHMDAVTSLAVSNNHLISGSKDKNLRLWSLDNSLPNIRCTTHAFNDYVNIVESDINLPIFYAGSRDGQVKVATVTEDKIRFIGGLIAHSQSVNSICSVGDRVQGIFITGSGDKTVKFWKPDGGTLDKILGSCHNEEY